MRQPPSNAARRGMTAAPFVAFAVAASMFTGCTGSPEGSEPSESPKTSPPPITSADSYVYTDAAGIEARLELTDRGAVLTIVNDTGAVLPAAGLFVLDARDGVRTDWEVIDRGEVPEGRSEWKVGRPPVPEAKNIGLLVLLFGGADYGAFVPPQPGVEP